MEALKLGKLIFEMMISSEESAEPTCRSMYIFF